MSEDVTPSIAELHAGKADAKAWFGLAVLGLPTLLVAIDMTVLHLAVPAITASIAPSPVEMLWIVDIYGFMIAGLLVTMGTLGDRLGRRRLLMVGSAGFGAASAIAAFAPSPEILIVARALLGFTAATLMPSTLSLISNMFPNEAERGVAIAIWSSMFMGGTAIGPLLGGFLLEHFWWGSVFLLNVPLTILLLIMAPAFLPEFRAARAAPIDMPSIALSLFGILSATYGIKQIASHGYDVVNLTTMLAGAVLLVGFTRRQLHLAVPMLDLSLFRFPTFTAALTVQFLVVFAVGAPYFLSAQYLQLIQDLSPLDAGLAMLPATIAGIAASLVASRLATAMRPAYVISIVLLVGAGGLGVLITLSGNSELWLVIVGLSLAFVGPSAATARPSTSSSAPHRSSAPAKHRVSPKQAASSAWLWVSRSPAASLSPFIDLTSEPIFPPASRPNWRWPRTNPSANFWARWEAPPIWPDRMSPPSPRPPSSTAWPRPRP